MAKRKRKKRQTKEQKEAAKVRRILREEMAPGRGVTMQDRAMVYKFYGKKCLSCKKYKKRMCLDHVIPLFVGGRHDPDNLQPMCWKCNKKKGIKIADYRPYPYPY